jgi:Zn-dependent protease
MPVSPEKILLWLALGYLLLRGARYLLGARAYLVCALRAPEVEPVGRGQLDPGELRLLVLLDEQLVAAGFRHLGFLNASAPLTYHGAPIPISVFVNERLPAYAFVRARIGPEYANLVELEIETVFASGLRLQTRDSLITRPFMTRNSRIEAYEGVSVADQVERHKARVAGERTHNAPLTLTGMERAVVAMIDRHADLRAHFRAEGWITPTSDPALDRFTLVGAFALAHYSRQLFGARKLASARKLEPSDADRELRVEADLRAMLRVAERPQPAPGTPWPLITVIALTAGVSFAAMALLWNVYVAVVILAVITFHEGGHALAMRLFGYRDVHVFFVPLLGAVTVGQPAATTVRDRLAVLLAGPLPGLWLGVLLLALDQTYNQFTLLRLPALALLLINGLNLLPFTPLDGGRVLESLLRPESVWRPAIHGVSVAGLVAVAIALREPAFVAIGVLWAALLPQQLGRYILRRAVAAVVTDRTDFQAVARASLRTMAADTRYARFRAATRQATARMHARAFTESLATAADRRWGVIAYLSALIPLAAGIRLWSGS